MLLTTFMMVLGIKSLHYHDYSNKCAQKPVAAAQQTVIENVCPTCDFVMHQAHTPQQPELSPVAFELNKVYQIPEIELVYHIIDLINSHSPPARA